MIDRSKWETTEVLRNAKPQKKTEQVSLNLLRQIVAWRRHLALRAWSTSSVRLQYVFFPGSWSHRFRKCARTRPPDEQLRPSRFRSVPGFCRPADLAFRRSPAGRH